MSNEIIITTPPGGVFHEGTINGTPKPGTVVQVNVQEPVSGGFDWTAFNRDADGNRGMMGVLLADQLQGKLATEAYVDGDRCFVYFPRIGEILNMLVKNIAGTGDAFAIGDLLIVNDGDGLLIATTGSPETEPWVVMETKTALAADALVECMFTGF